MSKIDYRSYIQSDPWKERRVAALERSKKSSTSRRNPACEMCGRAGDSHKNPSSRLDYSERRFRVDYSNGLEVHHLHYRTLGNEQPEDLIVLCTDGLYYEDHDRAVQAAMQTGGEFPPYPDRVGCHERCHDDPTFRADVARIAAARRE